jgi:CSLREA domain-containing protein
VQGQRLIGLVTVLVALVWPTAAQAQVGHIAGNPLDIYADGAGQLQFRFNGQSAGVFYSPESEPADAGLEIREGGVHYPLGSGATIEGPTLRSHGAGTRALHSVYTVGPNLRVTEDVTYTDQTQSVRLRYEITNVSGSTLSFSAAELADLYAAGSDDGTGVLEAGPPRFVGGRSANGALTGLVEGTPWSHYQAGYYGAVFSNFAEGNLNDAIDATEQDNGVGAQWDFSAVGAGQTRAIDVTWRLGAPTETIQVTTTRDGFDDVSDPCAAPSDCTLREAISVAPRGTPIDVPAGTYALDPQFGELRLGNVTLRGAGAGATIISGANQSRVLSTNDAEAFVSRLTITGGNGQGESLSGYGGGVYVDGASALTLTDVAVTDNRATGDGGGIYSDGALTVTRSVIARNASAPQQGVATGGGLAVANGVVELTNTTISGNSAARGAGLFSNESVTLRLLNATIAANHDGAGLHVNSPSGPGNVTAENTIIAGNEGGACDGAPPAESSHTLTDDASCALTGPGDRPNGDARLQPLTAGGTHPLGTGSQALDAADDALCPLSDQLRTLRPQGPACDIGAYELPVVTPEPTPEVTPPPPPPPPPPSPPLPQPLPRLQDPLPPPVVGKTVNATPKSGKVRIKLPRSKRYINLDAGRQIPVGTTIDTRKGRITLTSAADSKGATQTADFYRGLFRISQTRGAKPITNLKLVEKLTGCQPARRASASAKKKKPKTRKLWGNGKGRFRTTGQFSSATVRGTVWLTQDRCDRTLTRVRKGTVTVRDKAKRKTVVVRAGRTYTARAKRR